MGIRNHDWNMGARKLSGRIIIAKNALPVWHRWQIREAVNLSNVNVAQRKMREILVKTEYNPQRTTSFNTVTFYTLLI